MGRGAKGVTFLNTVRSRDRIRNVVDLNPHKHCMFVPGNGQQVIAPETLESDSPELVIVMNSIYRDEIAQTLEKMQVSSDLMCV